MLILRSLARHLRRCPQPRCRGESYDSGNGKADASALWGLWAGAWQGAWRESVYPGPV